MTFPLPQIDPGQILRLDESYPLALVKYSDKWLVFKDVCTHAECAFSQDGEVLDSTLICNCHGAEFDLLSGAVLQEPAEDPLRIFATQVVGNQLEVDL